ncbi:MAG: PHP domain-containing protein [Candidatus Omnitrophica bacterium]|nr:PHP domain-containing protein [Candidatus Omnitrophota bacterium]MDD5355709.1 PHP domain-containing protein [Candidatus Omnitrophota bacterium]
MKLADLHLHTDFSDGTFSPRKLVEEAKKAGLSCIAVTDHDITAGIAPAQEAALDSLEVIAGIELSSEIDSKEIHILGYFVDTESARLQEEIKNIDLIRRKRVYEMVDKLKGMGMDLEPDDVFNVAGQGSISRLHIAKAMLNKGKISNIYEAFSRYIGNKCPAYVGKFSLTPQDAIGLIKEAKGIAVLAHPAVSNCDELLPSFVDAGLRGIEAYYPEHSDIVTNYYLRVANKYNLLVTGGSDCHGESKSGVTVGKVTVPYELVDKLKQERYG